MALRGLTSRGRWGEWHLDLKKGRQDRKRCQNGEQLLSEMLNKTATTAVQHQIGMELWFYFLHFHCIQDREGWDQRRAAGLQHTAVARPSKQRCRKDLSERATCRIPLNYSQGWNQRLTFSFVWSQCVAAVSQSKIWATLLYDTSSLI